MKGFFKGRVSLLTMKSLRCIMTIEKRANRNRRLAKVKHNLVFAKRAVVWGDKGAFFAVRFFFRALEAKPERLARHGKPKPKVDCIWCFCALKIPRPCNTEGENPEGQYQEGSGAQDACAAVLHTHHLAFMTDCCRKQRQEIEERVHALCLTGHTIEVRVGQNPQIKTL